MHLVYPPKFCISIVFNFSWDDCNTQGKWKTKVMQNLGGGIRCIMGDVQVTYRPFPCSKNSHFQNEAKCKTFLVKTSFICMRIKTHFLIMGYALKLCSHHTGWLFVPTWMLSVIVWTLIWYVTLHFWDGRGAASHQNHRSYVWTEDISGLVFVPAQKLSSVVWMTVNIALNSLEKEAWRNSDMAYGLKPTRFFFLTKQLQDAFQRVSDESAQQKEALHALKQKESKATNMVTELTAVRFLGY